MVFSHRTFRTLNSKGLSLVEVMVVVGILSIISLGITSMFQGMYSRINQGTAKNTIESLSVTFRGTVLNSQAWAATIADAGSHPDMECLRVPGACTAGVYQLSLRDGNGGFAFNGYTNTDPLAALGGANNNGGFALNGSNCATFDPAAGNNPCPIAISTTYQFVCAGGAATCNSPGIIARMFVLYRPANCGLCTNPLPAGQRALSFELNVNNVTAAAIAAGDVVPAVAYTTVNRGTGFINDPVVFAEDIAASGAYPPPNTPACANPPAVTTRGLNTVVSDPNSHGALDGTGGVVLRQGEYLCIGTAPAFAVDSFTVSLRTAALGVVATSSGFASRSNWSQSSTAVSALITVGPATDTVFIDQSCTSGGQPFCQALGWAGGCFSLYDSGLPVPSTGGPNLATHVYGATTRLATLNCTKIN